MLDQKLMNFREKLVLDHFADEVRQDFDAVLGTFPHPHYELIATGAVHDDVLNYHRNARKAFPDQRHELIALRYTDDAVICEFWLLGTHKGYLGSVPPTGNAFRVRMCAFFIFKGEELVCERIYFDTLSIIKQLFKGFNLKSPKGMLQFCKAASGFLRDMKDLSKITKAK